MHSCRRHFQRAGQLCEVDRLHPKCIAYILLLIYTNSTLPKHPTTIRLEPALYKQVIREAEKKGLSFTNVVQLLLRAYIDGSVDIGVTQYPAEYLETLAKEADALRVQHRKGKVKGYTSSRAMFDAILER